MADLPHPERQCSWPGTPRPELSGASPTLSALPSADRHDGRSDADAASRQLRVFTARLVLLGAVVAGLLALSTIGLMISEGVGAWYAFRWALDTAATVGGFTEPRTAAGQVIHALLILLGVGTLFYALATLTEFFVGGELGVVLAARRSQSMIDSLADHYIICGYGRVGRQVAHDLQAAHLDIVVIDPLPSNREAAQA